MQTGIRVQNFGWPVKSSISYSPGILTRKFSIVNSKLLKQNFSVSFLTTQNNAIGLSPHGCKLPFHLILDTSTQDVISDGKKCIPRHKNQRFLPFQYCRDKADKGQSNFIIPTVDKHVTLYSTTGVFNLVL